MSTDKVYEIPGAKQLHATNDISGSVPQRHQRKEVTWGNQSEAGSCLRLIDLCITQLQTQQPFWTWVESNEGVVATPLSLQSQ